MALFGLSALGTVAAEEPLDLPTLPGYARAAVRDLNNRGYAVGQAFAAESDAPRQAVVWSRHGWEPYTAKALPTLPDMEDGEVLAISRSGIPVGVSSVGSQLFRAVVWMKHFGSEWEPVPLEPPPGLPESIAADVNSRGEIVGSAFNPAERNGSDVVQRAVLWRWRPHDGYSVIELATPEGFESRATGINEFGQIVGTAFRTEVGDKGTFIRSDVVVWSRPNGRAACPSPSFVVLAPLAGLPTNTAPAINFGGDVVAQAEARSGSTVTTRAVLWKRLRNPHGLEYGEAIELPVPEGSTDAAATDINAPGRVVGTVFLREGPGQQSSRPVVWTRSHCGQWTVEELEPPEGGVMVYAARLNDLGWVVGNDLLGTSGGSGALLWTPSWHQGCKPEVRR